MASFVGSNSSDSICSRCAYIIDSRRKGAEELRNIYYPIDALVVERTCLLCKLILQLLPGSIISETSPEFYVSNSHRCDLKQEDNGDWQVYFDEKPRGALIDAPPREDVIDHMDSRLIRQWMNECETRHSKAKDEGSQRLSEPIDITLVDIIDKCLIRASSRTKFIALSYVWGSVPMFVTTVSNRPELEQINGLTTYLDRIPVLIRDAMTLVQSIGQRYLWVDSLCIEQDHPAQKHNQIAHMDIIYGQAFFTIVALSAKDASSSLPGVRPGTRCTNEVFHVIKGQRLAARKANFSVAFQDAVYETRGWTMQERLFSKRCLYLTESAAYWSCCPSIIWSDNDPTPRYELCLALQATGNFSHALDIFRRPKLHLQAAWDTYRALVSEYTQRNLTFPTDTLNAFAGISAALQEKLGTSFTSGIPDCFLDVGLFWTPASLHPPMRRNENFSSWSWAGWIGSVRIKGSPFTSYGSISHFSRKSHDFMIQDLYTYRQTPRRPIHIKLFSNQNYVETQEKKTEDLKQSWDILSFSAFSTKISSFGVTLRGQYPTLLDKYGRQCGVLYAVPHSPIFAEQLGLANEIILLSKNRHSNDTVGTKNMHTISIEALFSQLASGDSTNEIPVCDWRAYSYEGNLVNVMLVTQKGEFTERLCLGCIHEDAWNASNPQMRNIILR